MGVDQSTSGMYPVWAKTAREFSTRLDKLTSGKARFLSKRMKVFADEFDSWVRPMCLVTPDEKMRRSRVVGDYMTCYRDALDVFASK